MSYLPLTQEAYNELEDERNAPAYGGYGNAMAQEAAWQHAQGIACSFDCAACETRADDYNAEQEWLALTDEERAAEKALNEAALADRLAADAAAWGEIPF